MLNSLKLVVFIKSIKCCCFFFYFFVDVLLHFFRTPATIITHSWIQVMYVNANSQMYTRQPNQCEFTLSAFESVSGELDSPKHTLPPNTVCRYHFQGRRHEIVWITFTKYHSAVDQSVFEAPTECMPQLRIWDGKLRANNKNGTFVFFISFSRKYYSTFCKLIVCLCSLIVVCLFECRKKIINFTIRHKKHILCLKYVFI